MHRLKAQLLLVGVLSAALMAGSVVAQSGGTAPEARYEMDAGTIGGMMGRGDSHELTLRLGSRLAPTGPAKADHFMPAGAQLGASVPLDTPTVAGRDYPERFQRPKGRLLLFWGCGARAGPGQPVVIDFARIAQGQMPPGLFSTRVPADTGPTLANSRTFGSWPNGLKSKSISGRSSLLGQHRVAGTYSPEIAFVLDQDFMPAPRVRSSGNSDSSTALGWDGVGSATGYYAWMMGGKGMGSEQGGDMVWWSSASTQDFGGGLWGWLAPATVARLITQKAVMPPSQTSCTVPAEVKTAAGGMLMGFLYAYGPEANFAFPERPANPKLAWHPKWTARVRYRSMATFMPGMPSMSDMLRGRGEDEAGDQPEAAKKKCKPKGLGGFLKKAAGAGC